MKLDDGQRWILLEAQQGPTFVGYLPEAQSCAGARWSVTGLLPLLGDDTPWSREAYLSLWRLYAGPYESPPIPHAWVGARALGEVGEHRPRLGLDLALPDGWDGRLRAELRMHGAWIGPVPSVMYVWVGLRRSQPSGCGCGCGGACGRGSKS